MTVKIALVANTDWYLYNFRLDLARFLREQGYEILLISPPGRYSGRLEQQGFRWLPWQVGRQSMAPWMEVQALMQLKNIYQHESPHLVHHHTIKPVQYGSIAARLAGVPAVVNSITGLGYMFMSRSPKARVSQPAARFLYRQAFKHPHSRAIFENENDRDFFLNNRFLRVDQTHLIASVGVDPERFQPRPQSPGLPLVVLPGRILGDKGVQVFIEVARQLAPTGLGRFALVGEPDPGNPTSIELEQIQSWVEAGIIEWWGWQEDMNAIYQQSHIVVLSSLGEGLPKVLLEAAACGRPVVASDIPGCREVVRDGVNGFLVPPNDPAALINRLTTLMTDADLRARMGAHGRQLVLEQFTAQQINSATFDVYRQAAIPNPMGQPRDKKPGI